MQKQLNWKQSIKTLFSHNLFSFKQNISVHWHNKTNLFALFLRRILATIYKRLKNKLIEEWKKTKNTIFCKKQNSLKILKIHKIETPHLEGEDLGEV